MKLANIFFMIFYGAAFIVVIYLLYTLINKKPSIPQTTVIYEQPIYDTPVIEVDYPWYIGYGVSPWWSYNWYGGGRPWGYRTRPGRWGPHYRSGPSGPRGGIRSGPIGSRMGGGRIGGGGGPRGGGGRR